MSLIGERVATYATVDYIATRSPISDTVARFQQAEKMKRANMIKSNQTYFKPWETLQEANPQQIVERRRRPRCRRC